MPTPRVATVLIAAALLYFFANQTQIGWLYVMASVLAGIVLTAYLVNRFSLAHLDGKRQVGQEQQYDLFEGDDILVRLSIDSLRLFSASHIAVTEHCVLAPPDYIFRSITLFIPYLPAKMAAEFEYTVPIDRRGLHTFPPMQITSSAPFGFFRSERSLAVPTRVLVYPEVRKLSHLDLLYRQPTPQLESVRSGIGLEVMGVRQYRTGDSPRHIHWRSVARTGNLISKEFAEETRPGLTLAVDLYQHPYPGTSSKHTPFEWAVKIATGIGCYAIERDYPLHLAADQADLPAPSGPLTTNILLEYLARCNPIGTLPLRDVIGFRPTQAFVAVILPWPDAAIVESLLSLQNRGFAVQAILLDPASFPAAGVSAKALAAQLIGENIETKLVYYSDDWVPQIDDTKPVKST